MNRPTSIRVFGQKYRITYELQDDDAYGLTTQNLNSIQLRGTMQEDKIASVLMHEITHAAIFESPLSLRKRFDVEEVCDIVGNFVLPILKANPHLIEYVLHEDEN